jgi:FtsZ-interacting cell division protein ZipA
MATKREEEAVARERRHHRVPPPSATVERAASRTDHRVEARASGTSERDRHSLDRVRVYIWQLVVAAAIHHIRVYATGQDFVGSTVDDGLLQGSEEIHHRMVPRQDD